MEAPRRFGYRRAYRVDEVERNGDFLKQKIRQELSFKLAQCIAESIPLIEIPRREEYYPELEYSMDILVMTREEFERFLWDYKQKVVMDMTGVLEKCNKEKQNADLSETPSTDV